MQNFNGEALSFNASHRLKRSIDQLIGICSGIVADGEVNDKEIAFLSTWLSENVEVCGEFPGNNISRRIRSALADGVISKDERDDLLEVLQKISGNRFSETGAAEAECAAIPADENPVIVFAGKLFCFTGKFSFGKRADCVDAVESRGGFGDDDVTKSLDYLVLGVGISKDWKHESYGRKIEKAQQYRDGGANRPVIISEHDWTIALESPSS